jgi:hypothetical protein
MSVNVHDSVMSPPQAPAGDWVLSVLVTDPLIKQFPVELLV